jgi:membrane protease YdiL (CAAX protease family)
MTLESIVDIFFPVVFTVAAAAAVVARWKGRARFGLGIREGTLRQLTVGLAIGASAMGGTVATILLCGGARIDGFHVNLPLLGLGLAVFAGAAFAEELAYRGLLLTGLIALLRRPLPALLVSAVVFGLVHVTDSPDATVIGIISDSLGGLMYGVAFLRSRHLWMPVGIHFSWNFVQASVFGFPTSGNTSYSGAMFHVADIGPQWLGGGGYGPEGSIVSLGFRLAVIGAVLLTTRSPKAEEVAA